MIKNAKKNLVGSIAFLCSLSAIGCGVSTIDSSEEVSENNVHKSATLILEDSKGNDNLFEEKYMNGVFLIRDTETGVQYTSWSYKGVQSRIGADGKPYIK